jgi:shikimate dehydrogenase
VSVHEWSEVPRLLAGADVLINNTSLGMAGKPPLEIDLTPLKKSAIVYDVVYVPLETPLLKAAKAAGHRTVDGLSMLLYQAVNGFSHWFGVTPKVTAEQRAMLEADIRAKTG